MRTANPALNDSTFENYLRDRGSALEASDRMTLQGTVARTGMLLVVLLIAASYTWGMVHSATASGEVLPWVLGGAIGGFVIALVIHFKKTWAPSLSPVYAAAEGLFLGGLSAIINLKYPGIAFQAVTLTVATALALLIAYSTRLIQPSENFKLGVAAATGGIALVYLFSLFAGMFGYPLSFIHSSSPLSIGISVFITIIAALNLVLDFDFIESAVERGAPKHMEWYAAFGLLVTLVWLYVEILRLLRKLQER